ncbi:hypothetical protein [Klebsiella oxytoca]|uniref:hypothetical protein n=1 Tax=Klebsiella oxytoca TaxID=571 RepID=UPI00388D224C|nr:hypothetical protein [Klebsiella oxytoca]HCC6327780.1 hypothetical protein [Klebsiella oxytoca]
MTDITELAQREKFEAWWERTQHNGNPPRFGWECWRDGEGYKVDDDESELDGMWEAWKAAGAELVEALEKAQKSNEFLKGQLSELANFNPDWDKLEASYDSWREIAAELLVAKERIAELEESHAQVIQSRDHYKRMTEEGLKRLAESRTVTVKLPDYRNTYKGPFADEVEHQVRLALELFSSAAGIKWEAG